MSRFMSSSKAKASAAVFGVAASFCIYQYLKSRQKRLQFRKRREREIFVVNTAQEWEDVYPRLSEQCSSIRAVGFDCEWVMVNGQRAPVALVQIATHEGLCILVRLFRMAEEIPISLRMFLSNKRIYKVGVASREDGNKLLTDYGIPVYGCVDLRHVVSRVRGIIVKSLSLQGLARDILQVDMEKGQHLRCGEWEAQTLSQEQIDYAADDALVGIDIFLQLMSMKIYGISQRQHFYGTSVATDKDTLWTMAGALCQGLLDMPFRHPKSRTGVPKEEEEKVGSWAQPVLKDMNNMDKLSRPKHSKAFMTRKRPLYDNCVILAPDGTSLTTCDSRKAEWYLAKGLAKKVQDDPLYVQLNFEPSSRPTSDRDYYLQEKENICVVCGSTKDYIRRIIVPQEYRKYFPAILKDHSSHDVLLLCIKCHLESSGYDLMLKQQLAQECDAPLDSGKSCSVKVDQALSKVVSAAKALLQKNSKIPEERVRHLEDLIKNYYGISTVTEEVLQTAAVIDVKRSDPNYIPHGQKVVQYYMSKEGGLIEFEKMWRRQFVETMKPKFLPALWSIDHRPERMMPYGSSASV